MQDELKKQSDQRRKTNQALPQDGEGAAASPPISSPTIGVNAGGAGSGSSRPMRVHLSQLPRDMEDDELHAIASDFGAVLRYDLHRESLYKCGWIEYATLAEAEAAVAELHERRMDDWHMLIEAYVYPSGGA